MKKYICVLTLLLCAAIVMSGCRADTSAAQESAQTEIVNPVETYDSISKLNDALGFDMIELDPDFGFVPYEYDTIDKRLGQIEYTDVPPEPEEEEQTSLLPQTANEPLSDKHITLRMAPGDEDITGISGVEYEIEDFNGLDVNVGVYQNTVYIGWWIYQDYCYSVAAYNIEGSIADEMINSLTAKVLGIDVESEND